MRSAAEADGTIALPAAATAAGSTPRMPGREPGAGCGTILVSTFASTLAATFGISVFTISGFAGAALVACFCSISTMGS